jgi:archaellin
MLWEDPTVPTYWSANMSDAALQVSSSTVWTINLYVINPASRHFYVQPGYLSYLNAPSSGASNGATVQTNTIVQLEFVCESMTLTEFPFDSQECSLLLQYADAYYTSVNFLLTSPNFRTLTISNNSGNEEWNLNNVSVSHSPLMTTSTGANYGFVITLFLSRNSYYYLITLIMPTVVLQVAAGMTFLLPSDKGEKVVLGATLVTVVYILEDEVNRLLPPPDADRVPHIVLALQVGFILTAISLVEGVCVQTLRVLAPELPARINYHLDSVFSRCCKHLPWYIPWHTDLSWQTSDTTTTQTSDSTRPTAHTITPDSRTSDLMTVSSITLQPANSSGNNSIELSLVRATSVHTTSISNGRNELIMTAFLHEIADTMQRTLDLRMRNAARLSHQDAIDRPWRRVEYVVNIMGLMVYIGIIVYYFGVSIY